MLLGASIIAFLTTPLGTAVVYVSTQLAGPMAHVAPAAEPALALPPPATGYSTGAAGSGLDGLGGVIAPSATSETWPGTGPGNDGGPFAFVGAHHGSVWGVPARDNNARGVGYCVMEDVAGTGSVTRRDNPAVWDASEMARAGAVMSTFGGDRVVPYGINDSGSYNLTTGEWEHPLLLGGGEYTRRRQVAVNFGVRMFLEDLSVDALPGGRKLARDTAVVDGSGGDFAALRNGYRVAQYMAEVADIQSAVGGVSLTMDWRTPDGVAPTAPGTYPLDVIVTDSTGRRVGMVPVLQLSAVGIGANRSVDAVARVDNTLDSSDDMARWNAAAATGWPVWGMVGLLDTDPRFEVGQRADASDVADRSGVAHFDVTITSARWELAFHTQAPTNGVALYAGTGIQGQVTWAGPPQSASVHAEFVPPDIGRFQVRKMLDDAEIQGTRDMSDFTFEIARVADGSGTGAMSLGAFTTEATGRTQVIEAAAGEYRVTEVDRPPWASGLVDTGPITFRLDGGPDPGVLPVVEFVYTNLVPAASITTAAADHTDGDQFVTISEPGSTGDVSSDTAATGVVDTVTYCGLVPGTEYRLLGSIHVVIGEVVTPSGVEGSATFVPAEPCGVVDVTFELLGARVLRGEIGVVFQTLVVAATGQVVARHEDPASAAQTLFFPEITTSMQQLVGQPGDWSEATAQRNPGDDRQIVEVDTDAVDVVIYDGLAAGRDYRAELTLYERLDDGSCVATDVTAVQNFSTPPLPTSTSMPTEPAPPPSVAVGPVALREPGVFVGFERIHLVDNAGNHPSPSATLVAAHEACDDLGQTLRVIEPSPPRPAPPAPPPPIEVETTSTTSTPPGTTTAPIVTVAVAGTPPTTAPATSTSPTTAAAPPHTVALPRTGSNPRTMATGALLLATCGVGALAISRRRW